ncbi:hypothetical protein KAW80_01900 [Candidatus Babeliales bacterium]|nr:hypothetical protein [Candidatus Babeliales bacterium]
MNSLRLNFQERDGYLRYIGKKNINISFSKNLKSWQVLKKDILLPRQNYFDSSSLHSLNAILTNEGILLVYFVKTPLSFGVALFDKKNPSKLLWRSANPIWKTQKKLQPIKVEKQRDDLVIYFQAREGTFEKIVISLVYIFGKEHAHPVVLERVLQNPILKPIVEHSWESQATFNAAAIYLEEKVHLLYRAIGREGNSVLGYAASKEGVNIEERLDYPVYLPRELYELRKKGSSTIAYKFMSGGGYGGCEDPRLTKLDNKLYMTYTAFNGSNPPAVALTSINIKDFLEKKWRWASPVLISKPGEIHKNWVIFPEKINGRYAILHSISPEIRIDYFDSLEFKDHDVPIKSFHSFSPRENCWDNMVRGAGPPPIRTEAGWLVIYHGIDKQDPSRYKLGAMILDYDDPTKIIYRSPYPILEPDAKYENDGFKPGIVYTCGAIVVGEQLLVYYGGADTVTCTATTPLNQFLNKLKASKSCCELEYV